MTQTYKCDFCSTTGTHDKIVKHEHDCSFNPSNRKCWTCIHRYEEGAPISGYWNECGKGHSCIDVEDGDVLCIDYTLNPNQQNDGTTID